LAPVDAELPNTLTIAHTSAINTISPKKPVTLISMPSILARRARLRYLAGIPRAARTGKPAPRLGMLRPLRVVRARRVG
jgi:hypothetical protein